MLRLLYNLFSQDDKTLSLALHLIRPDSMLNDDFLVYVFTDSLSKQNITIDALCEVLTESSNEKGFITSLKSLNVALASQDLSKIYSLIAIEPVSAEKIKSILHMDSPPTQPVISKCKFLSVLADVYQARQTNDAAKLHSLALTASQPLSYEAFYDLIRQIDPSSSINDIERYHTEALNMSSNIGGISSQAFCRIVLRYGIGGMGCGAFYIPEMNLPREEFEVEATPRGENSVVSRRSWDTTSYVEGAEYDETVITVTKRKKKIRRKNNSKP